MKVAASVWFALTLVNEYVVTAPTELPSTRTSATWYCAAAVMEMASVPPGATVCAPDGDTEPFAPADAVIVNPAVHVPDARQ